LRGFVGAGDEPAATRVAWLRDVARALAAAHRRGLVHRDIKPENVMVRDDGIVKVLDFGIARRAHRDVDPNGPTQAPSIGTLTATGIRLGTPLYMAPVQIRGDELDGRADQFAWGVLAYEILTGKVPWRGGLDAFAVVASVLTDEADGAVLTAAGASPEVTTVILRALEKRPERRFASMDELLTSLDPGAPRTSPPIAAADARPAPAPGDTTAARYGTEEVREILVRAVERQEMQKRDAARLGFDELLAAARVVGVDPETLREASRDLRARAALARDGASGLMPGGASELARASAPPHDLDDEKERQVWLRAKQRDFKRHLGMFILVNGALIMLGVIVRAMPWMLIPGLLWAIGLGAHALTLYTTDEDEWREEREEKRRREWKRRKRDDAMSKVVDQGMAMLIKKGEMMQGRHGIRPAHHAAWSAKEPDKVRIAPPTEGVRLGEVEAEAELDAAAIKAERATRERRRQ